MTYEKTHDLLDLAIWMQSNREGVALNDIADYFKVSRRTAERMRNMILLQFPQGTLKDFIQFSAEELSVLFTSQRKLPKQSN